MKNKGEKPKNISEHGKNGGARPGAGRKPGGKNKKTKEEEIVREEFRQRVLKSMSKLINAQMNLAQGAQMLFKLETKKYKNNKGKWQEKRLPPKLVTNQSTIESYLAGELKDDQGNDGEIGENSYYFITTAKPDNKALDSLIDRVFGKSVQRTELTGADGDPIAVTGFNYIKPNEDNNTDDPAIA